MQLTFLFFLHCQPNIFVLNTHTSQTCLLIEFALVFSFNIFLVPTETGRILLWPSVSCLTVLIIATALLRPLTRVKLINTRRSNVHKAAYYLITEMTSSRCFGFLFLLNMFMQSNTLTEISSELQTCIDYMLLAFWYHSKTEFFHFKENNYLTSSVNPICGGIFQHSPSLHLPIMPPTSRPHLQIAQTHVHRPIGTVRREFLPCMAIAHVV